MREHPNYKYRPRRRQKEPDFDFFEFYQIVVSRYVPGINGAGSYNFETMNNRADSLIAMDVLNRQNKTKLLIKKP